MKSSDHVPKLVKAQFQVNYRSGENLYMKKDNWKKIIHDVRLLLAALSYCPVAAELMPLVAEKSGRGTLMLSSS